jgi:rhodanese-related sulfurtransferase
MVAVVGAWGNAYSAESDPAESKSVAEKTTIAHVDAAGASKLLREKNPVILDVRTPEEFKAGHLAKSKNVDFNAADFEKKVGALDRTATYLVHCQSGGRSTRSLEIFKKLGFKSVVHLDGGYRGWEKAGFLVER